MRASGPDGDFEMIEARRVKDRDAPRTRHDRTVATPYNGALSGPLLRLDDTVTETDQ